MKELIVPGQNEDLFEGDGHHTKKSKSKKHSGDGGLRYKVGDIVLRVGDEGGMCPMLITHIYNAKEVLVKILLEDELTFDPLLEKLAGGVRPIFSDEVVDPDEIGFVYSNFTHAEYIPYLKSRFYFYEMLSRGLMVNEGLRNEIRGLKGFISTSKNTQSMESWIALCREKLAEGLKQEGIVGFSLPRACGPNVVDEKIEPWVSLN